MKYLKKYKVFENNQSLDFLIEDLFGVDPFKIRDIITSLLDELDVPQFEIRYSISSIFNLDKEWRHLIGSDDFSWQYELFIDNEKGLHKVDYDMWERFRTKNNIPYDKFSASVNIICYKQHNNNFDELHDVIDFINDGLSEYDFNMRAEKKFSGFLSPDFGNTGYLIQLTSDLDEIKESANFNSMTDDELEEKLNWLRIEYADIQREISQIVSIQRNRKESSEEELTKSWPDSIWDLDKYQLGWVLEHGNHTTSKHYDISHKYIRRLTGVLDSGFNPETNQFFFYITPSAWQDHADEYFENENGIKSIQLLVNNLKKVKIDGEDVVKFKVLFSYDRNETHLLYYNENKIVIVEGRYSTNKKEYKSIEDAIKYLVLVDHEDYEDD